MRTALAGLVVAAAMLWVIPSASANAPNPIPGTTTGSVVTNADGSHTVTVQGQWIWLFSSEANCSTDRNGIGYNVAWFDGNTVNPIGTSASPDKVIYVGDKTDNIVHSLNNLDPSNNDPAFPGVPMSYFTHNSTSSTPTNTDADNWVSNCGSKGSTGWTGTWGPIAHTYAASDPGPFQICPVFYDPHGKPGVAGSSHVGDITAGGSGHNNDNSYEGNGSGTNGDNCTLTTITIPPPTTPTTLPPTPPPSGTIKAVCTVSTSTVHLHGASGSKTKTFTVSVSSFAVEQVRFYVDGHLVATVTKAHHGKFSTKIDPSKYGFGGHHVTAKIKFSAANCGGVTRHGAFVRPKPAVVVPKFTG